jgi:hypothetical protein
VTFTFKPTTAGAHTAVATLADGTVVGSALSFTVVAAGSGAVSAAGTGLSTTGTDGIGLPAGARVIVLAGVDAVLVTRRRQTARIPG